jgi:GTP-binding protein EngB required for normal cell division
MEVQSDQPILPPDPNTGRLRDYVRDKQAVAQQVRGVEQLLKRDSVEDRAAHDLMVKLAEDRFTLAVVGQFKRGKSSLMNAIIGRELLPTGVLPLTSAITILRFGPKERLVISQEAWSFEQEAPVSELESYVTEKGNPGNAKRIKAVYIEFPSPFLRRGLEFVDTPGIGSAIAANTTTTERFITQCDAVLFVTSADAPLSAVESEFLGRIQQHVRKVFFVVNKMDLLTQPERADMLEFVAHRLSEQIREPVRLFPVSSREGLAAKAGKNNVELDHSGFPAMEMAIAEFLANQRASTFLSGILDRAEKLLASEADQEAANRRNAIHALRDRILSAHGHPASIAVTIPINPTDDKKIREAESVKPIGESEVIAALRSRTCAICRRLSDTLFHFFAKWQYQLATNEAAQRAFAADGGFCPLHTWQLAEISSPHGLSLGFPVLLETLTTELSALAAEPNELGQNAVPTWRNRARSNCRACQILSRTEMEYTRTVAATLALAGGREAYAQGQGVCLHHLDRLAASAEGAENRRFLFSEAARHCDELVEDMQSFATKRDATRRYLTNRDEDDAYLRAITVVSGTKNLCFPWRLDEPL